jgi:hypothetical protein
VFSGDDIDVARVHPKPLTLAFPTQETHAPAIYDSSSLNRPLIKRSTTQLDNSVSSPFIRFELS